MIEVNNSHQANYAAPFRILIGASILILWVELEERQQPLPILRNLYFHHMGGVCMHSHIFIESSFNSQRHYILPNSICCVSWSSYVQP